MCPKNVTLMQYSYQYLIFFIINCENISVEVVKMHKLCYIHYVRGVGLLKKYRSILLSITDIAMVLIAYFLALWVRLDFSLREIQYFWHLTELIPVIVISYFIAFKLAQVDKTLWSSPSVDEALRVTLASFIGFMVVFIVCEYITPIHLPISVHFIALMLVVLIYGVCTFLLSDLPVLCFNRST
jgi:hypothetical protein